MVEAVLQNEEVIELDLGNKFNLQLANFNGPLDFLLELVRVNKIEICDIFVSEITEQFMQYLSQIESLDVDMASEYMSIAATLLEIKSRALLPIEVEDDVDEDDPGVALIKQLEQHKIFREIATEMKEHESVNRFYREADKSVGVTVSVIKENLSIDRFMKAFTAFIESAQSRVPITNVSRAITKEQFTVAGRMRYVKSALLENGKISFEQLFVPTSSNLEIVTTFSAVLEMMKMQLITVEQLDSFADFAIVVKQGANLGSIEGLIKEVADEETV